MWGSTPGNTIVAGLNAMKAKIPDFITDKKEATKIRREMDKSIADLDQIDYLEKVGKFDAADKKRAASLKFGIDTWGTQIAKATALTGIVTKEITDKEIAAKKEIGETERNRVRVEGGKEEARIRSSNANTGIKDYGTIQARMTSLMDQERKLREGPLKDDLRMIKYKDKFLANNPKPDVIKSIQEAERRVKEQLDPVKAEIEQLNRVKMNLGVMQNLPGQVSGTTNPNLPDLNSDKYKLK